MAGIELTDLNYYIKQNTRNKIVICQENIGELEFINVGYDLSQLLSMSSYNYEEAVSSILDKTSHNEFIGNYLALTNISILFEPELKLNIRDILDSYSKNQCLIVQAEAELLKRIDLQGLSHLTI